MISPAYCILPGELIQRNPEKRNPSRALQAPYDEKTELKIQGDQDNQSFRAEY